MGLGAMIYCILVAVLGGINILPSVVLKCGPPKLLKKNILGALVSKIAGQLESCAHWRTSNLRVAVMNKQLVGQALGPS